MDSNLNRAVLAAVNVINQGGRILVSSRSFWSQFGFPALEDRRDVVAAARTILKASSAIESGGMSGTLADLYGQYGYPSTESFGGTLGRQTARVYAQVEYQTVINGPNGPEVKSTYKSIGISVPWDMPLWAIDQEIADAIVDTGDVYGTGEGSVVSGSTRVY